MQSNAGMANRQEDVDLRFMQVSALQLPLVLFSLYVNDMPSPSHHVELALYADDTAIIATSCQLALLIKYVETYLGDLKRWLSEWRIAISVSKSSAMPFTKTGRRIPKPRSVQLFGEPIQWVDDARYLGGPLINSSPGRNIPIR